MDPARRAGRRPIRWLAAVPQLDVGRALLATVAQFRSTLLVFSWRDIQIYAPVDGRGGNPLQHSFEVFYARNPLRRLRGALGGLRLMRSHYGELWRNLSLVRRVLRQARRFHPAARAMLGAGAVSVVYEQLGRGLPKGTVVAVGEGEVLLEKVLRRESLAAERCYLAGQPPRPGPIHEPPAPLEKTACNNASIETIWPQLGCYLDAGDFYVGVQTKRGCPHNCCYCIYTVIEGKAVRINPMPSSSRPAARSRMPRSCCGPSWPVACMTSVGPPRSAPTISTPNWPS